MTHQSSSETTPAVADPCRQVTQLRELLALVRNIAGHVPNAAERESANLFQHRRGDGAPPPGRGQDGINLRMNQAMFEHEGLLK